MCCGTYLGTDPHSHGLAIIVGDSRIRVGTKVLLGTNQDDGDVRAKLF